MQQTATTAFDRARHVGRRSLLGVLAGLALGAVVAALDAALVTVLPATLRFDPDHAGTLVGSIVGGIITVAVFSLWMRTVMVGLVSVEFSPRLLASYLEDRFQENVTYGMLAALAFCCVVLFTIPAAAAPLVGMTLSMFIAFGALVTVLLAIQHAVRSLSVSQVIRDLTDAVLTMIEQLPYADEEHEDVPDVDPPDTTDTVHARELGWVVAIDLERIADGLAPGSTAQVVTPVGSFLRPGHPIVEVDRSPVDEDAIRSAVEVHDARGPTTTIGFGLDQLVDVGQHALLASENDSATAHEVLLHLGACIEALLQHSPRATIHLDDEDRAVRSPPEPGASVHVGRAFRRLRPGAAKQIEASRDVLETLGTVHRAAERVEDEATINAVRSEAAELLELQEKLGVMTHTELNELTQLARHLVLLDE